MTWLLIVEPHALPGGPNAPLQAGADALEVEHGVELVEIEWTDDDPEWLNMLQEAVGGYIEYARITPGAIIELPLPARDRCYLLEVEALIVNEEGLLHQLPINHFASLIARLSGSEANLVGTAVIVVGMVAESELGQEAS